MIKKRIREGHWDLINRRYVIILREAGNVPKEIVVIKHITELKSSIIRTNIRQSFALHILTGQVNASMEIFALSLTQKLKFQSS